MGSVNSLLIFEFKLFRKNKFSDVFQRYERFMIVKPPAAIWDIEL